MVKSLHLRYFVKKDDTIPYDSHFLCWANAHPSIKQERITEMADVVVKFMDNYPDGRVEYAWL